VPPVEAVLCELVRVVTGAPAAAGAELPELATEVACEALVRVVTGALATAAPEAPPAPATAWLRLVEVLTAPVAPRA
jgi:hypothetical protein